MNGPLCQLAASVFGFWECFHLLVSQWVSCGQTDAEWCPFQAGWASVLWMCQCGYKPAQAPVLHSVVPDNPSGTHRCVGDYMSRGFDMAAGSPL